MIAPACASTTVQLSDQNVIQGQKWMVYEVNASGMFLVGTYNTTDLISLNDSSNYVWVLKPSTIDYIHNPEAVVELWMNSVPVWVNILIGVIVVAVAVMLFRRILGR